jgi:hypothetical protein
MTLWQAHEMISPWDTPGTQGTAQFRQLLNYLDQPEDGWDLGRRISLGDVALAAGAMWAWQAACCLDWTDGTIARSVIGALLPALRRVGAPAPIVAELARWCAGEEVDLAALSAAAEAAAAGKTTGAEAAVAARVAADAAVAATRAAPAAKPLKPPLLLMLAAILTAESAPAREEELAAQVADLAAAFPPLHSSL